MANVSLNSGGGIDAVIDELVEIPQEDTTNLVISTVSGEYDLPARLEVRYVDFEEESQTNVRLIIRSSGIVDEAQSDRKVTLDVPISISPVIATRYGSEKLFSYVSSQQQHNFIMPPKFLRVEPSDVLKVTADQVIRVVKAEKVTLKPDFTLDVECNEYLQDTEQVVIEPPIVSGALVTSPVTSISLVAKTPSIVAIGPVTLDIPSFNVNVTPKVPTVVTVTVEVPAVNVQYAAFAPEILAEMAVLVPTANISTVPVVPTLAIGAKVDVPAANIGTTPIVPSGVGMTFPTVEASSTYSGDWAVDHVIPLPAGIQAGDLLILFFRSGSTGPPPHSVPAGWTEMFTGFLSIRYKIADGTEGTTVTISMTNGASRPAVANCYRILGYKGAPEMAASGGTDSPSLTTSWGIDSTLWFSVISSRSDAGVIGAVDSPPPNYTDLLYNTIPGTDTQGALIAVAWRRYHIDTEDPGAFTGTYSTNAMQNATVAVRPGTPTVVDVPAANVQFSVFAPEIVAEMAVRVPTANISIDPIVPIGIGADSLTADTDLYTADGDTPTADYG